MGNMAILFESASDDAQIGGGSWVLPLANLLDADLTAVTRSLDAELHSTRMHVAFARSPQIEFIVVGPGNFSPTVKVRIRAGVNAALTSPVYDSGWVSGLSTGFVVDLERGSSFVHQLSTPVAARYWLIELDDLANPAGYIEISRLFMSRGYIPSINYPFEGNGLSFQPRTVGASTLAGGRIERYRPPLRSFAFALNDLPESEGYGSVYRLGAKNAFGRQVFVIPDVDDASFMEKRAFFGTIQDFSPISQPHFLRLNSGARIEEQHCPAVYSGWPSDPFLHLTSPPSLYCDFSQSELPAGSAFARSTGATFVGADGLIQSAGTNIPRYDHDPSTGECLGLLIEDAVTNLLLRSEEFDNAAWARFNFVLPLTHGVSPRGTLDADLMIPNDSVNTVSHTAQQMTAAVAAGATVTFSQFFKAAGYDFVLLRCGNSTETLFFQAMVNVKTGDVVLSSAFGVGAVLDAVTVTEMKDGFFRVSVTGSVTGLTSYECASYVFKTGSATAFTGDGVSGIYMWGAQCEDGQLTSYVPTVAATVSRSGDVLSVAGANFASVYNQAAGTVFVEFDTLALIDPAATKIILSVDDGTTNERGILYLAVTTNVLQFILSDGAVAQASVAGSVPDAQSPIKVAYAYALNNVGYCVDGAAASQDNAATMPSVTQMRIGHRTTEQLNGHIRRLAYYPRRLTNAELQTITTQ